MPRPRLACLTAAIALTAGAGGLSANGVSARYTHTWAADGIVSAAVAGHGVVYLGGSFNAFGERIGPMVLVERATGTVESWPLFMDGTVSRILPDPDGGYLVQADSPAVDGAPGAGFFRVTSTGQLDPAFHWPATVLPAAAFIAADRLVVSVDYTTAPYYASAILDRRSGRIIAGPLPFRVLRAGTGPGGTLIALVSAAGAAGAIAQLNATSGATERTLYTPPAGYVIAAAAISGADVFVAIATGGPYATPSGTVLRVDPESGAGIPLATVAGVVYGRFTPAPVTSILPHQGRLFLSGNLTSVNGTPLSSAQIGLAAIDAASGALTTWQRPQWAGTTLVAGDEDRLLFVSGGWPVVAPPFGRGPALYALDADSGAYTGWHLLLLAGSLPSAIVVPEATRLLIGGHFTGIGTLERAGLAAVTLPDGRPTAWAPVASGTISGLALAGSRLFAVEGYPPRVVEFDTATGARAAWSAAATGNIRRMAVSGNRLFLVGPFTAIDGLPRNGVASFDLTTVPPTLEPWTLPFAATDVSAIQVVPQAVLLGGIFPITAGVTAYRLLAVDPVSGGALPWLPNLNERSSTASIDLAVTADRLFVSGLFDTVNDQPRPRLAAFDFGGRLLPWQVDDARGVAYQPALTLFEDRAYLTGLGLGFGPAGVAFDLSSGRRTDWVPRIVGSPSGGAFLPVPGLGVLYYGYSSGSSGSATGSYAFYPRIPSLAAVTGLHGAVSGSQVRLWWDTLADAESYVIEAGSGAGLANLASIDTRSPEVSFATAAPNGRYYVRVRGRNEGGTGPVSNEIVVVIGSGACAAAPGPPSNLQASVSGLTATLIWQAPSAGEAVARYAIDLVSGPGSPATVAQTVATTFSGSGPPGTFAVAVRAENACGSSVPTDPVTVTLGTTVRD